MNRWNADAILCDATWAGSFSPPIKVYIRRVGDSGSRISEPFRSQPPPKLLESDTLKQQATNNSKEQFANSPDLKSELLSAIIGALDAHGTMSRQPLASEEVRDGLKNILLNHAQLYESLRQPEG